MKKILAILGIIILLSLLLLPPVLRITLPNLEETKEENKKFYKYLTCSGLDYTIRTNYQNDQVQLIVFRRNTTAEIDTTKPLDNLFITIKNDSMVVYNQFEEGEAILLDFTTSVYPNLNLSSLSQLPDLQQSYYEQYNLTCTITEE